LDISGVKYRLHYYILRNFKDHIFNSAAISACRLRTRRSVVEGGMQQVPPLQ